MARFTDRQQTPERPPMYQPPRSRPPRAPADPALQQRSWAAVMLAVLSVVGMLMMSGNVRRGVFVVALALLFALIALWLAISSMSRARRGGSGRPRGVIFATIVGAFSAVFSAFVLIGFAIFWPQLTQYSTCLQGANTVAAQQACQQQLSNSVGGEISIIGG
jgi:ABC-type amino acid transport system permease subunit